MPETKTKKIYGSEFRYLDNLKFDSECFIYHDKIAYVSFEENNLRGVIVQDMEMAKLQRTMFEFWHLFS